MAEEPKKDFGKKPDDKKDDKKAEDSSSTKEAGISISVVFGIIILLALFLHAKKNFSLWSLLPTIPQWVYDAYNHIALAYIILANILCLFLLVGLVYSLIKVRQVQIVWFNKLYPIPSLPEETKPKNDKWERILTHIGSDNSSDWRLAILEADIVLDELLDYLGYVGDTIGDKLKKANPGDFRTIDMAWEAHKIRNAIAHEGQDFALSQREAQRIIGLYQNVFNEFEFI